MARISEPATLALHAAALLAWQPERRIANQEIAAALQVSGHHLAKVMQQLVHAVHSHVRQYLAGTTLARLAKRFTLVSL